jgi:hypothetical protein
VNLVPESLANTPGCRLKGLHVGRKNDLISLQARQETVMRYPRSIFNQHVAVCHTARGGHYDADTAQSSAKKLDLLGSNTLHAILFNSGISMRSMLSGSRCFNIVLITLIDINIKITYRI